MREPLLRLYREHFGAAPAAVLELPGDGSSRTYRRLVGANGRTVIGAFGPDREENRAFLSFSRSLRGVGLPVPEVYAADELAGVWLLEDLGDTTLFDALREERRRRRSRLPRPILDVYRRVLEILPRFQIEGHRVIDYSVAYPRPAFDRQSILWDLNYFKYHFLKLAHVPFNEERLERDFDRLAEFLLDTDRDYFLYRDFQSRNILLRDGEPWFIDFQGGRRGALPYDVASLLYDAKADIPSRNRDSLLEHYLDALGSFIPVDRGTFRELYRGYVLVRVMQALGAYGYRGFFERKPRFLESVPFAARNLAQILDGGLPVQLPEIATAFRRIVDEWAVGGDPDDPTKGLMVVVTSFSYRHGYPHDVGGHGGGFVFDCRAIPNPGRRPEHRETTGLDPAVAAYIEAQPELSTFWESARSLVDAQVAEYLRRGFTSLSIAFGCTGGQHRSVYLAERLARHLRECFPAVRVRVIHREEPAWPRPEPAASESPRPERAAASS
ncbi:MAG TPA: RNase adapter RapZ [Gemmatimonadota bacterium]|nr:RNase adapter RapZ [Gemmatimonadota bacterium]